MAVEGLLGFERLERIDVPTLCVHGDADIPFAVRLVREWAQRLPLVDVHVIANAGHLVSQKQPEAFSDRVLAFLGDLTWAQGRRATPLERGPVA